MGWIGQIFWKENLFPPGRFPGREHRPPPHRDGEGRPPQAGDLGGIPSLALSIKWGIIFLLCSVSTLASISILTGSRLRQLETEKLQAELL
jgi:hypothetical protein